MKRFLPKQKRVLVLLLALLAGLGTAYAYDFSAICETGQTLYYNIIDADNHYVALTCPGAFGSNGWSGYTQPIGDIVLPTNVQYDGVTYIVTSIGYGAFYQCSGLTGTLAIPESVTFIEDEAFGVCGNITSLTIPNSIISIGDWAFSYCSKLNSLTIPNSVISIGEFAFAYSSNIATITIGNSVATIGRHAFSLCSRVTSVFIPNSVTSIGENPFDQCSSLRQIVVGSGNPEYDSRNNCNAIIHTSTNCLITGCKNTRIPDSITSIGNDAFLICTGLTGTLTIPNSVTSIGNSAFSGCRNLTGTLVLPNSLTTIGNRAFSGCRNLTGTLTIPRSVFSIGECAFINCSGIEQMIVDSENLIYDSRDNCNAIILTSTNQLVFGCQNTIIPNYVSSIGFEAFFQCTTLKSMIIPDYVISVGAQAFFGCNNLSSLTIGSAVTTIGQQAFGSCNGLTSIVVNAETPPTLLRNSFLGCPKSIPVYVPCGSLEAYQSAEYWNVFTNIQESCTQAQTITISEGWSWFSTYIEVDDPITMLQMVEAALGENGVAIKSSDISTEYDSEWGWFGDLDDVGITNEQMYKILVSAPCTVTVEGIPANPANHPITIVQGWNWIGFPSPVAMSLEDAFASFAQEGDRIKSSGAQIEYDPEWGWYGDFETLEPGHGYMYYSASSTPRTLVFPSVAK